MCLRCVILMSLFLVFQDLQTKDGFFGACPPKKGNSIGKTPFCWPILVDEHGHFFLSEGPWVKVNQAHGSMEVLVDSNNSCCFLAHPISMSSSTCRAVYDLMICFLGDYQTGVYLYILYIYI